MQSCDARGAGHAPQTHEWHPDHVRAQPDHLGDSRLQGWHGQSGHRRRHDEVDVLRRQSRCLERFGHSLGAELDPDLDEGVIGLAEVTQLGIALDRECQVPGLDTGVAVQALDDRSVDCAPEHRLGERGGDLSLLVAVLGQRASDAQDAHADVSSVWSVPERLLVSEPAADRAACGKGGGDSTRTQTELDHVVEHALILGGGRGSCAGARWRRGPPGHTSRSRTVRRRPHHQDRHLIDPRSGCEEPCRPRTRRPARRPNRPPARTRSAT